MNCRVSLSCVYFPITPFILFQWSVNTWNMESLSIPLTIAFEFNARIKMSSYTYHCWSFKWFILNIRHFYFCNSLNFNALQNVQRTINNVQPLILSHTPARHRCYWKPPPRTYLRHLSTGRGPVLPCWPKSLKGYY